MDAPLTEESVDATLTKLKAAEPSKKIDVIQVFGLQLEQTKEIPSTCFSAITLSIPPLLKSTNHLLQQAVLFQLLPYYLPHLPTRPQEHLRLATHQLLPGLLEKMHEAKEKVHVPAEQNLVILGALCYKADEQHVNADSVSSSSHKGKERETLGQVFEGKLKEAMAAKGARTKLGSLKILLGIRDSHAGLSLRPFMPLLVDLLQDSDGAVREAARSSIVNLLSPSTVPPAARSELRKLMTAKGVKQTLADAIVQQIHDGPAATITHAEAVEDPESAGPKLESEASVAPVIFDTERDVTAAFAKLHPWFQGKETEQNWLEREKGVNLVRAMLAGGVHQQFNAAFMACMKEWFAVESAKVILSLRTTLATATTALYLELAQLVRKNLDPVADIMFNALGKMSSLTKKIVAEQAQRALLAMIKYTTCHARFFLPFLDASIGDKNVQTRQYFSLYLKTYLETHGAADRHHIELGGFDHLTESVKKALSDINPIVKENGRAAYSLFCEIWPKEGAALPEKLEPTVRKQLERARTVSGSSAGPPQPALRKPGTSSTSDAIRKARMEARGRSRIVSADTGTKASEHPEANRRLSLQPQLMAPAPEPPAQHGASEDIASSPSAVTHARAPPQPSPPRQVLPLTDSNLAQAEASGALASVATTIPAPEALGLRPSTPPKSRGSMRSIPSSSTVPVSLPAPPSVTKPAVQRTPPKSRISNAGGNGATGKRSQPDSPSPASLSETLLDVDLSYWLDELPERTGPFNRGGDIVSSERYHAFSTELQQSDLTVWQLKSLNSTMLEACPPGLAGMTEAQLRAKLGARWEADQADDEWTSCPDGFAIFVEQAVSSILDKVAGREIDEDVADEVLFCLWTAAMWFPEALSGQESGVYEVLFAVRDFAERSRRSSAALSAALAKVTNDPVSLLNAVVSVYQKRLARLTDARPKLRERLVVFGLISIARLVVRLPGAVIEDEIKRLEPHIMEGMSWPTIVGREAASTTIVALQSSLKDEARLFAMLHRLSTAQRSLLTYMFQQHGGSRKDDAVSSRGTQADDSAGHDSLVKRMSGFTPKM